jgi:hypothetical protein
MLNGKPSLEQQDEKGGRVTALTWDQIGDRQYETGVDHGVLYLTSGIAVPWNGLVSVVESRTREVKSYYLDGLKYLDHVIPGDYSAKVRAFTYPEELEVLLGTVDVAPGVVVYDQLTRSFHMSYRTGIGNDLEGLNYGYKIHVVYNVTAMPTDVSFETVAESVSPQPFEWDLKALPNRLVGIRPSCHISLDSRTVNPTILQTVEDRLYGSASLNPNLPSFSALLAMVS